MINKVFFLLEPQAVIISSSTDVKHLKVPCTHENNQQLQPSAHCSTWLWRWSKNNMKVKMTISINRINSTSGCSLQQYLLALPSQTQQWTPRLPLYTHRIWLNPKSSVKPQSENAFNIHLQESPVKQIKGPKWFLGQKNLFFMSYRIYLWEKYQWPW